MKIYKPANFYLFFNNKMRNVGLMFLPIPLIFLNTRFNENNMIGKIIFYATLLSLIFVIKPLVSAFLKRKEKYEINEEALIYHHPTLIGENINSYSFGKMNVELKTNIITNCLVIDDFTPEDNEVILYLKSKKECVELFKLLQTKNASSRY